MAACCSSCTRRPQFEWLPYHNGWLIASQLLSIYATALSWLYWPVFAISLVTMSLYQSLWCFRWTNNLQHLYLLVFLAVLSSNASLGIGLYVSLEFTYPVTFCTAFDMYHRRPYDRRDFDIANDYCDEQFWMAVAYTAAILWALAACCLVRFIVTSTSTNAAESGPNNSSEEGNDKTSTAAVAAPESSAAREETIANV